MLVLMIWGSGLQTLPPSPRRILRGALGAATGDQGDEEQAELILPHRPQPLQV